MHFFSSLAERQNYTEGLTAFYSFYNVEAVRIWDHYAIVDGKDVKFY